MSQHLRLGEILLKHGMITEASLEKALENQVVFGARLGTNLVERDLVHLDDVGRCLVVQKGIPQANTETISGITDETLSLLAVEICVKYGLLPLGRDEKGVKVAMIEPSEELIARLSAHFGGQPVQPHIMPELRLQYCLERFYNRPRPKRFLRLPDGGEANAKQRTYLAPTLDTRSKTTEARVVFAAQNEVADEDAAHLVFAPLDDDAPSDSIPNILEVPVEEETEDDGLIYLDQIPTTAGTSQGHLAVGPNMREALADKPAVDQIVYDLIQSSTGSEIAQLLVKPLCESTATTVLFWVRGELAVGCCTSNNSTADVSDLVIPLDAPSVFQWALKLQSAVRASANDDSTQGQIAAFLQTPMPQEVCIAPVRLAEKIVNLICVHSQPDKPLSDDLVADLRAVADAAGGAYQRLMKSIRQE